MIKNIIKRVIVGVLIAIILGFINSCEVNAITYTMNMSGGSWYANGSAIPSTASNLSISGISFYQIVTNAALNTDAMPYVKVNNVHSNNNYDFRNRDYVAFVVWVMPVYLQTQLLWTMAQLVIL